MGLLILPDDAGLSVLVYAVLLCSNWSHSHLSDDIGLHAVVMATACIGYVHTHTLTRTHTHTHTHTHTTSTRSSSLPQPLLPCCLLCCISTGQPYKQQPPSGVHACKPTSDSTEPHHITAQPTCTRCSSHIMLVNVESRLEVCLNPSATYVVLKLARCKYVMHSNVNATFVLLASITRPSACTQCSLWLICVFCQCC